MPETTDLQVSRPVGPDLRSTAARLTFKDTAIPTPLADGWHAHRQQPDVSREPSRFALFKGGQLVALVTARSSGWKWRVAVRPGADVLVAGRSDLLLEQAMLQAQAALRQADALDHEASARLLARWEGRDAGA